MKRIKLYAYWAQNLGDDLMVHILLKRYPKYLFVSDSWVEHSRFLHYRNFINVGMIQQRFGRLNHLINILTLYTKPNFLINSVIRYYNHCKASIYIGGSLYQEECFLQSDIQMQNDEEKLHHAPLFIIGANFGPYQTDAFKDSFARYFRRCGGITFRDRASFALFADNEKVAYAPDVVFCLNTSNTIENNRSVLISVIDLSNRDKLRKWTDIYDTRMAEVCKYCVLQNKTPVLMSFCKNEGDEKAIQRIMNKLSEIEREKTKVFRYSGDLDSALELYQKADRVIATRFHAMVLALKYGKPVYSISYNQKVKNVLSDIQLNAFCELNDLEHVSAKMLFDGCHTADISIYSKEAEKQFTQFDSFMRDVK